MQKKLQVFVIALLMLCVTFPTYGMSDSDANYVSGSVRSIFVSKSDIFLGIYDQASPTSNYLKVSHDGGTHWEMPQELLGDPELSISAELPNVYVGAGMSLYFSKDNGSHWQKKQKPYSLNRITSISSQNSNLYAVIKACFGPESCDYSVSMSSDFGDNWKEITPYQDNYSVVFAQKSNLYVGADSHGSGPIVFPPVYGLAISRDNGITWNGYLDSIPVADVYASGNNIYAGSTTRYGLFVSLDNGAHWQNFTTAHGLGSNDVWSVFAFGSNIIAGTDNGVSISTDNGAHWRNYTTANGLPSNRINKVFVDNSKIFAGTDNGLAVSTDNGEHWTRI